MCEYDVHLKNAVHAPMCGGVSLVILMLES